MGDFCMRRAVRTCLFLFAACCWLAPAIVHAAAQQVDLVNGIGLIDYSHKQRFKPGTWLKYRVTGSSEAGMSDDYIVTLLIAGEETFWGEDCFWVETQTELKNKPGGHILATLMSYSIFDDSLPLPHMQLYSRKMISEIDERGRPVQQVTKRPPSALTTRKGPGTQAPLTVKYDTLGVDTVVTPPGSFDCKKISIEQGVAATSEVGDSTIRTEVHEDRVTYMNRRIPITSLAREDIVNKIERKSWKAGESQNAEVRVMDHATGSARLIAFGEGMQPQLVPVTARSAIKERRTSAAPKRVRARPKGGKSG
jgi:hypothetical protein